MDESIKAEEGRGRSARKRAAKAVEQLAWRLVDLPEAALAELPVGAHLEDALREARQTRGHSSRKRQVKYLAGLLRKDEQQQEDLQDCLAQLDENHGRQVRAFHDLEDLRERLCTPATSAAALEETRSRFPQIDDQRLTGLVRSALEGKDKKAFREIFRRLRRAREEQE